jgi:flavin reductase (DIM6/NTAB) family NADH-FMN oxidoreductase RutF
VSEKRRVGSDVHAGRSENPEAGVTAAQFREAFGRWAAAVTIVAVRDGDGAVHATTVSSFAPVSADPPLVAIAFGAGAQVLPWVKVGAPVGVSMLREDQGRWASIFADSMPVASPSWSEGPAPVIPGSVAALACRVEAVHEAGGGSRLLVCALENVTLGEDDRPLLYWQRAYRKMDLG